MSKALGQKPFRPEFRERMLTGVKTATSRTSKWGEAGDFFTAFGRSFVLTSVRKLTLNQVASQEYLTEGLQSPDEFIAIWESIHPLSGYVAGKSIWFHRFELVKE